MDEKERNKMGEQPTFNEDDDDIEFDMEFDMDDDSDMEFDETEAEKPASPMLLFEKLGGSGAMKVVVNQFYHLVMDDELLRPYFAGIDMKRLEAHQVDFVSFALGGPAYYSGHSLSESHRGLSIKPEHYDLTLGHLAASLLQAGVSEEDTEKVMVLLRPLKAAIAPDSAPIIES